GGSVPGSRIGAPAGLDPAMNFFSTFWPSDVSIVVCWTTRLPASWPDATIDVLDGLHASVSVPGNLVIPRELRYRAAGVPSIFTRSLIGSNAIAPSPAVFAALASLIAPPL